MSRCVLPLAARCREKFGSSKRIGLESAFWPRRFEVGVPQTFHTRRWVFTRHSSTVSGRKTIQGSFSITFQPTADDNRWRADLLSTT